MGRLPTGVPPALEPCKIPKSPYFGLDHVSNRRLNFNRAFENAQACKWGSTMLAIQNLLRPAAHPLTAGPACPNCGRSMHLARIAPRSEGLPDIHIFRCGECGVSLAEAADDAAAAFRG